jgi:hypothetical protein
MCMYVHNLYRHQIKLNVLSANGSLVIAIKPKGTEHFRMVAMLLF